MSLSLTNLMGSEIKTFSLTDENSSISLVFVGTILKDRKITCLYPLDYQNNQVINKGLSLFKAKKLAAITNEEGILYFKVHQDLAGTLPIDEFQLACNKIIFLNHSIRGNVTLKLIDSEEYNQLEDIVHVWKQSAYNFQNN